MNSTEIAKVLTATPKTVFMFKLGGRRSRSDVGRILETHEQTVSMDRYGYRLSRTRRVTTYTVELISQTSTSTSQNVTYEIRKYYSKVRASEVQHAVTWGKTLEELCEERTQAERAYKERMDTEETRKQALVTQLVLVANVQAHELQALKLSTLEALVKAFGDNDSSVLVFTQEE